MANRLIKAILLILFSSVLIAGCANQNKTESSSLSSSSTAESLCESNASSVDENKESSITNEENSFGDTESSDSSIPDENSEIPPDESGTSDDEQTYVPDDDELVLIKDYIPTIKFDIRYATENNFTGQVIYDTADTYLRYGTVKKLKAVQEELELWGLSLLIWDAYRPTEAQQKLWDICPDPNFVSNPKNGFSGHCRGEAIDITVITASGTMIEMPSNFDEFTALADRDYSDVSAIAAENSQMLEDIMEKHGFSGYRKEWWHYSDTVTYPVYGQEE